MGSAGHYSDRFFNEPAESAAHPSHLGVPAEGQGSLGPTETIAGGRAQPSRSPWRTRAWTAAAVVAAVATVFAAINDQPASDDQADPAPTAQVASRAGIQTLEVNAVASSAVLWATRGYTYDVDLTNNTSETLEIVDVASQNSGTELVWNRPLTIPTSGTAHLRVDFLVTNCAAVAVAPAPAKLRLTLRAPDSVEPPGVAEVAVVTAGRTIDESSAPLCPAQPSGAPPLTVVPS